MANCCNTCTNTQNTIHTESDFQNKLAQSLFYFSIILYLIALSGDFGIFNFHLNAPILYGFYLFCYFALGYEILKKALIGFYKREFFNENSLMALASIGAWAISQGAEAVAILLFYRIGEALESLVVEKSKKSIRTLASIKIEQAHLFKNEKIENIDPKNIQEGDILVIFAGERIPADGIIIKGEGSIDNSALNGESLPQNVKVGDSLFSGSINLDSILHLKATKSYENSTFSKIIKLIEEGSAQKSRSEEFITKFARYYTPIVTLLAFGIILFPTLYFWAFGQMELIEALKIWLYRGIIFLVVSCPCALVISIPLTFFASLGKASKEGILIKGSSYIEALKDTNAIIFDKTGTLTKGKLIIKKINSYKNYDEKFILKIAQLLESHSNHPIAKAIMNCNNEINLQEDLKKLSNLKESSGGGVSAMFENKAIALGNARFIQSLTKQNLPKDSSLKCQIFIAYNGETIGDIILEDAIKNEAKEAIEKLKREHLEEIYILSGDKESVVQEVAQSLGIKHFFASLLPNDKVNHLKIILETQNQTNKKVIFVGDGINDAPSLALCDIGIAMGKTGSDVALEGADIVIMNDDLRKIPKVLQIAKKTRQILWQNIFLALGVKIGIMILGAFGATNLWIALFGDVGVALLALLNAIRAIR